MSDKKYKKISKSKYIRLLSYFKPFIPVIFANVLLAILIIGVDLAGPYITKIVVDDYIIAGNRQTPLWIFGAIYLVAVVIGAMSNYYQVNLFNLIGQKIMYKIRVDLFSHMQNMNLSFFDRNSSGRITTRITNDVESLNEMFSGVLIALFKDIFSLIGIIIVMLKLDAKMALISFSIMPLIFAIVFFYNKKAVLNFRKVRALISRINGFFAENISGMKIVQIFNREKEKYNEFSELNDEYKQASLFEVVLMSLFKPSAEVINYLGISILIWYSMPGIFNTTIELGVLFAFITYIKKFFEPIKELADKYNVILSGGVSADRIFELMDNTEGFENFDKGGSIVDVKGKIEFRNVWFSYNNRDWVLKNVSFTINSGETAAFVGSTGSGKSTIINLIGRFYEIQKGEIFLDDVNTKSINLKELRQHIAVVMQDVFMFAGDIESNIKLNKNIHHEDVVKASEYVNAHSFIEELPGKYSEEVKERGCTLSLGQRQLLSFARAIAFNPSIIVLDEATSNIDTDTEKIIQDSLKKISKDRTTVVIAHRLSTIKDADKIIVIDKGRIKEMGRHEELIELGGIYFGMCEV